MRNRKNICGLGFVLIVFLSIALLCGCSSATFAIKDDIKTKTDYITDISDDAIKELENKGITELSDLDIDTDELITMMLEKASWNVSVDDNDTTAKATITVFHFDTEACSELLGEKSEEFKNSEERPDLEQAERFQQGKDDLDQSVAATTELKETEIEIIYKKNGDKWVTEEDVSKKVMDIILSDDEAKSFVEAMNGYSWTYDNMNASQILETMKENGLSIGEIQKYDENTDPNGLLGRPDQYLSKASFIDTRVKDPYGLSKLDGEVNIDMGGTVEVFETAAQAKERENYIDGVTSSYSLGKMYTYRFCNVLFRVGFDLTPTQAEDYEKAFFE